MAKTKQIKGSRVLAAEAESSFPSVYQALRMFKQLSHEEATVFVDILRRKKVTIDDVKNILNDNALKSTTSKPYALLKTLIGADLVFPNKRGSRNNAFDAIHPRDLLFDIKESIQALDDEVTRLESEESQVLEQVREEAEFLFSELEITTTVNNLVEKGYALEFFYNPISISEKDAIFKRLTKRFLLNPQKADCNVIFATKKNDSMTPIIAVLLSKRYDKKDQSYAVGNKVVDPEACECLRKGLKK